MKIEHALLFAGGALALISLSRGGFPPVRMTTKASTKKKTTAAQDKVAAAKVKHRAM